MTVWDDRVLTELCGVSENIRRRRMLLSAPPRAGRHCGMYVSSNELERKSITLLGRSRSVEIRAVRHPGCIS